MPIYVILKIGILSNVAILCNKVLILTLLSPGYFLPEIQMLSASAEGSYCSAFSSFKLKRVNLTNILLALH